MGTCDNPYRQWIDVDEEKVKMREHFITFFSILGCVAWGVMPFTVCFNDAPVFLLILFAIGSVSIGLAASLDTSTSY